MKEILIARAPVLTLSWARQHGAFITRQQGVNCILCQEHVSGATLATLQRLFPDVEEVKIVSPSLFEHVLARTIGERRH